jgi:hypothetical protein
MTFTKLSLQNSVSFTNMFISLSVRTRNAPINYGASHANSHASGEHGVRGPTQVTTRAYEPHADGMQSARSGRQTRRRFRYRPADNRTRAVSYCCQHYYYFSHHVTGYLSTSQGQTLTPRPITYLQLLLRITCDTEDSCLLGWCAVYSG